MGAAKDRVTANVEVTLHVDVEAEVICCDGEVTIQSLEMVLGDRRVDLTDLGEKVISHDTIEYIDGEIMEKVDLGNFGGEADANERHIDETLEREAFKDG